MIGDFLETEEAKQLGIYLAQTLISWGVPATVGLAFILVASGMKGPDDAEPEQLPPALAKALGLSKEPKEYLKIERLNSKLLSFDYSLAKATVSKEAALRTAEQIGLKRRFGAELASFGLESRAVTAINKAESAFRKRDAKLRAQLDKKTRELRAGSLTTQARTGSGPQLPGGLFSGGDEKHAETAEHADKPDGEKGAFGWLPKFGGGEAKAESETTAQAEAANASASDAANATADATEKPAGAGGMFMNRKARGEIDKLNKAMLTNELSFLRTLSATLTPEQASTLAAVFKSTRDGGSSENQAGGGGASAVSLLAESAAGARTAAKHVYVLKFFGDVTASQVSTLRQEITAVLRNADASREDEVLLVLNTGGGTVTGYGLAAAQLTRLKSAGVKLTICIEQVAASGGYMMACTADEILASPFAVVGSIGVITEQPNVYERLKKEGVVFSTITAGKFKRTLTPTKKIDPLDEKKLKEDINQILNLFKGFVAKNRPKVDIEQVATGETWFGPDALANGLVDGLCTVDEVLLSRVEEGNEVLSVTYAEKPKSPLAALSGAGGSLADIERALAGRPAWKSAALAVAARLLGVKGDALLGGGFDGGYDGGVPSVLSTQDRTSAFERQMMAARVSDEAEPMLQWSGEEVEEAAGDSWFL